MKLILLLTLTLCFLMPANAQTATVIWRVTSFDVAANVQLNERMLNSVATINATNVGTGPGRTLTVRLNSKASVKSVTVGGAAATFRPGAEPRGDLQRIEISLPSTVAPNGATTVAVTYSSSGREQLGTDVDQPDRHTVFATLILVPAAKHSFLRSWRGCGAFSFVDEPAKRGFVGCGENWFVGFDGF